MTAPQTKCIKREESAHTQAYIEHHHIFPIIQYLVYMSIFQHRILPALMEAHPPDTHKGPEQVLQKVPRVSFADTVVDKVAVMVVPSYTDPKLPTMVGPRVSIVFTLDAVHDMCTFVRA